MSCTYHQQNKRLFRSERICDDHGDDQRRNGSSLREDTESVGGDGEDRDDSENNREHCVDLGYAGYVWVCWYGGYSV
jgi:hypothetical protein